MENNFQVVLIGYPAHHIHHQLVVIVSYVHFFKQGRYFKLAWSNLIVSGSHRNTQFPGFDLKFFHEIVNAGRDSGKIVIFKLLSTCW